MRFWLQMELTWPWTYLQGQLRQTEESFNAKPGSGMPFESPGQKTQWKLSTSSSARTLWKHKNSHLGSAWASSLWGDKRISDSTWFNCIEQIWTFWTKTEHVVLKCVKMPRDVTHRPTWQARLYEPLRPQPQMFRAPWPQRVPQRVSTDTTGHNVVMWWCGAAFGIWATRFIIGLPSASYTSNLQKLAMAAMGIPFNYDPRLPSRERQVV